MINENLLLKSICKVCMRELGDKKKYACVRCNTEGHKFCVPEYYIKDYVKLFGGKHPNATMFNAGLRVCRECTDSIEAL